MRTAEERARLVLTRTASLRRARSRRRRLALDGLCVAGCLVLIVCMGLALAGIEANAGASSTSLPSGTASILASGEVLGYVLMGIMSFVLGVCVTVLLNRTRRLHAHHESGREWGVHDDEL